MSSTYSLRPCSHAACSSSSLPAVAAELRQPPPPWPCAAALASRLNGSRCVVRYSAASYRDIHSRCTASAVAGLSSNCRCSQQQRPPILRRRHESLQQPQLQQQQQPCVPQTVGSSRHTSVRPAVAAAAAAASSSSSSSSLATPTGWCPLASPSIWQVGRRLLPPTAPAGAVGAAVAIALPPYQLLYSPACWSARIRLCLCRWCMPAGHRGAGGVAAGHSLPAQPRMAPLPAQRRLGDAPPAAAEQPEGGGGRARPLREGRGQEGGVGRWSVRASPPLPSVAASCDGPAAVSPAALSRHGHFFWCFFRRWSAWSSGASANSGRAFRTRRH